MADMPGVAARLNAAVIDAATILAERDRAFRAFEGADLDGLGSEYRESLGLALDERIA